MKEELKQEILQLVKKRGPDKTICPSEAARSYDSQNWRNVMDEVRSAASKLQQQGTITIEQNGKVVSPEIIEGPIRLRLRN